MNPDLKKGWEPSIGGRSNVERGVQYKKPPSYIVRAKARAPRLSNQPESETRSVAEMAASNPSVAEHEEKNVH